MACTGGLPALSAPPDTALRVTSFGAVPDDEKDDAEAIRSALRALPAGGTLVFPPGRYLQQGVIEVKTPGAVLWGFGATLHATDLREQAVMLRADGASLYGFKLTAVTQRRLEGGPECARVAVYSPAGGQAPVTGNVVRSNAIVPADRKRPGLENGAGGAGIFVFGARDFVVAENRVERSLADGIHVTEGSSRGVVVGNVVRNTGDDGIGVVSYCPTLRELTDDKQADALVARSLVRDVLVAGNEIADQFWGRGLAVVGATGVTLEKNRIRGIPFAAGILVAREDGWHTCGSQDIVVDQNSVASVQVAPPSQLSSEHPYPRALTGHAALEVHALATEHERAHPGFARMIRVGPVRFDRNVVRSARFDGVRVGDASAGKLVGDIQILGNYMAEIGGAFLQVDQGIPYLAEGNRAGDARPAERAEQVLAPARGASQRCDTITLNR